MINQPKLFIMLTFMSLTIIYILITSEIGPFHIQQHSFDYVYKSTMNQRI